MMIAYLQLMRLDKPIGTLLLLWPTLCALWLTRAPSLSVCLVLIAGVFVMRSAGCVVNDLADRNFDGHVERTKHRPLASGLLTVKQAIYTLMVLLFIALLLVLVLNPLCWLIAVIALITAMTYPFMKRYTHLPQLVLGIAFSCGILMAYAATINQLPLSCWLLFIINLCWTVAYDTEYAMEDRRDDLLIGIKSTAILFGQFDKLMIALLQVISFIGFVILGLLNQLGFIYYVALFIVALLFIYQQWLIKDRAKGQCFKAFLSNNYVGLVIFTGIVISSLLS